MENVYNKKYYDPNLLTWHTPRPPRKETVEALNLYNFTDNSDKPIVWTPGQLEIIDCILNRGSQPTGDLGQILKRIEIIAATQYGKSLAVAAGVSIRASSFPEQWAIVAGTTEKARIIMEYVIMLSLNNPIIRRQMNADDAMDRIRMKRSVDRLVFKRKGEVRVYTADASRVAETSKALMGFGCIPAGFKVLTDKGEIEISELVKNKNASKVYSYNHKKNKVELQKILEYQDNLLGNRRLFEIYFGGKKIQCTEDHPIWIVGRGYTKASEVRVGDVATGFELTNKVGFGITNVCKSFAKSVTRFFIKGQAMLRGLSTIFVVLYAGGLAREGRIIPDGRTTRGRASFARTSLSQKAKRLSFAQEYVWGYLVAARSMTGHLVGKIITLGKKKGLAIRDYTLGLQGHWENQEYASIAERMKPGLSLFTGLTKAMSTKESSLTGLDCAQYVIRSTTQITPKNNKVYNLTVEHNKNYFIEGMLLHNSPNVIEDEAALIGDVLQATVMRMLGGTKDNFLVKIGNPFNRGHFHRTWVSGTYYRIFIDYQRALDEGRYTKEFVDEMAAEALFEILYGCKFPEEGTIDAKGWLSLLTLSEIERAIVDEDYILPDRRLGGDIAGGGRNYSVLTLRGYNVAKKIYKENEKDTMVFAGMVVKNANDLEVKESDIFLDAVGIGRGASDRVRELKPKANGVQAGMAAGDVKKFANLRAEMYWRMREWILTGGKLFRDDDWNQLGEIKYKVDSGGKIKIMSKEEMLKEGIDSPDVADSLALTFARADVSPALRAQQEQTHVEEEVNPDPYD